MDSFGFMETSKRKGYVAGIRDGKRYVAEVPTDKRYVRFNLITNTFECTDELAASWTEIPTTHGDIPAETATSQPMA